MSQSLRKVRSISKVPVSEFFKVFWDSIWGFVRRDKSLSFDLNKVPSKRAIKILIGHVKKRYPKIHDALIHKRNVFMAKRLVKLAKSNPESKIVAFVGAGHEEGMNKLIDAMLYSLH